MDNLVRHLIIRKTAAPPGRSSLSPDVISPLVFFTSTSRCHGHTDVNENTPVGTCRWLIEHKTTYQIDCNKCGAPIISCKECVHEDIGKCTTCNTNDNCRETTCICIQKTNKYQKHDTTQDVQNGFVLTCPSAKTYKERNQCLSYSNPNYINDDNENRTPVIIEVDDKLSNGYIHAEINGESIKQIQSIETIVKSKGIHKDRKLSTSSRKFYEHQDKLIEGYEEIHCQTDDKLKLYRILQKKTNFYAKLSFIANLILLIAKTAAAILSGSMAIITSLVDSVVDIASGLVVWMTTRAVRKTDRFKYPNGRRLSEPVAIIVLSVIMALASLQLIKEAAQKIYGLAKGTQSPPTVDYITIAISVATVVIKFGLYMVCRKVKSPTVLALAQDHKNDVLSNSLAILCGYVGSKEMQINTSVSSLVYVDPVGAIVISLYIAVTWYITGRDQTKLLIGVRADNIVVSKVMWTCMHFSDLILFVNSVRAYHAGYDITVEVDIGLPECILNAEVESIQSQLKTKLEKISNVNQACVSVSFHKQKVVESIKL